MRNKGFLFCLCFVIILGFLSLPIQAGEIIILNEDFEDVDVGEVPEGFNILGGKPQVTNEIRVRGNSKSLKIVPNAEKRGLEALNDKESDLIIYSFDPQKKVTVEFSVYMPDAIGNTLCFICSNSLENLYLKLEGFPGDLGLYICSEAVFVRKTERIFKTISVTPTGKTHETIHEEVSETIYEGRFSHNFEYRSYAVKHFAKAESQKWHRIKVVIYTDVEAEYSGYYDIYIDDMRKPEASKVPFTRKMQEIAYIGFTVYPNWKALDDSNSAYEMRPYYIDNLKIFYEP